jgi:uncharacterized protein
MRTITKIIFLQAFILNIKAQNQLLLFEKHLVKRGKVLFRVTPANKATFDLMNQNGLIVKRFELEGGIVGNELTLNESLRPYSETDTSKWLALVRRDKDKAGFVYQALYQNKADPKIGQTQGIKQEKMIYDLLLLSADLDAQISKACGLFFADSSVNKDHKYLYKIAVRDAKGGNKDLLQIKIDPTQVDQEVVPEKLNVKGRNNIATLSWRASELRGVFSGYVLERSEDTLNFKRINSTPVILMASQFEKNKDQIHYNDTMPRSKKKYHYRIRGINYFGELSAPSAIVSVFSSPSLKTLPVIDSIRVLNNKDIFLKWRMEDDVETALVKKYVLMRSERDKGRYKAIYSSSDKTQFTDHQALPLNYYKVGAINYNNDTLFSFARMANIIDTIAPEIPKGLEATVDPKGNVKIFWVKNREKDLLGYKVFKANALDEEFVQMNNRFVTDTFYHDKLNLKTLSKKIYYSLSAVDNNYNNSAKSIPIEVKRPDTIPPAAPFLRDVQPGLEGVVLRFTLSKSSDVNRHCIYRSTSSFKEELLLRIPASDTMSYFVDTIAEQGSTYSYLLKAFDEDNNVSSSKTLALYYETGYRKKMSQVYYMIDRTLKNITLTWNYDRPDVEKFVLYRGRKDEPLTIIKTLGAAEFLFIDNSPHIGNVYEYRIKAVMKSGAESIISDPIKIIF